jgi:hypothetical protein
LYVVAQSRSVFLEHHCAPGRRSPAAQQPSKLHEQTALHKGLVEGCLPVFASQAETNGWGIEITKGLPLELKQRSQKFLVSFFLFQAVEVLCASPTSLQKFCQLKAGIQQHGNTLAS